MSGVPRGAVSQAAQLPSFAEDSSAGGRVGARRVERLAAIAVLVAMLGASMADAFYGSLLAQQQYADAGRMALLRVPLEAAELFGLSWLAARLLGGLGDEATAAWRGAAPGLLARLGPLVGIGLLALGLRVLAALGLHLYGLTFGPSGVVLDDEGVYDKAARALLAMGRDVQAGAEAWVHGYGYLGGHHLSWITATYAILGAHTLLVRLGGALLGATTAVLGAAAAAALFGGRAGIVAGLVLAAFPGLVVWSSTLLRESLITGAVAAALVAVARGRQARTLSQVVLALGALHVIATLRPYAALALGLPILAALLVVVGARVAGSAAGGRRLGLLAAGTVALSLVVWQLWPTIEVVTHPTALLLRQTAMRLVPPPYGLMGSDLAYADLVPETGGPLVVVEAGDPPVELPGMVIGVWMNEYYVATSREQVYRVRPEEVRPLAELPAEVAAAHLASGFGDGLKAALLAPFSTGASKPVYRLLAADTLLWLGLLVMGLVGLARTRMPALLVPLGFTWSVLLALAVVPGHPGNLIRHREALTVLPLTLAAAPVLTRLASWLWSRRQRYAPGAIWAAFRGLSGEQRAAGALLAAIAGSWLVAEPGAAWLSLRGPLLYYVRVALDLAELAAIGWLSVRLVALAGENWRESGPRSLVGSAPVLGRPRLGAGLPAGLALLVLGGVLGRLLAEGHGAAIPVLAALLLWGVLLMGHAPPAERAWVVPVIGLGLALRVAAAVGLHLYGLVIGPRAIVLDDESAFDLGAQALASLLDQPGQVLPAEFAHLEGHLLSLLAALYAAFGPNPLVGRLAEVAIGTAAVFLAALTARVLFGRGTALAVGLLLAAAPSLVVWSAAVLKEALVSALVMVVLLAVARWRQAPSFWVAALVAAAVHVLLGLRLYAGLILGLCAGVAMLLYLWRWLRVRGVRGFGLRARLAVLAAGLGFVWLVWPMLVASLNPTTLLYLHTVMRLGPVPKEFRDNAINRPEGSLNVGVIAAVRLGNSALETPAMVLGYERQRGPRPAGSTQRPGGEGFAYLVTTEPISDAARARLVAVEPSRVRHIREMSWGSALVQLGGSLADGAATALLAPLNTGMAGAREVLVGVDAVVWLAVVVLAALGLLRAGQPYLLLPVGVAVAAIVALAVVPGNPGNLVRHRGVLAAPALALAAGPALEELSRLVAVRWRDRRRGPSPRGVEPVLPLGARGGGAGRPSD